VRRRLLACAAILARAEIAAAQDPAASVLCDREAGTLVVRYTDALHAEAPAWSAPIRFLDLLDLDETESTVEGTRSQTVTCRLGDEELEVVLAPGVPNVNLLGRCGAAVTGVVTVKQHGEVALAETWFEDLDCHARERMLVRVTLRRGAAEPELEYRAYESDG
jgi:hypothetical protein